MRLWRDRKGYPTDLDVSVPLPGFSGLRPVTRGEGSSVLARFSPVAGIQWVETSKSLNQKSDRSERFSPVAGIQWVETVDGKQYGSSLYDVSVPLPGFSGLRLA